MQSTTPISNGSRALQGPSSTAVAAARFRAAGPRTHLHTRRAPAVHIVRCKRDGNAAAAPEDRKAEKIAQIKTQIESRGINRATAQKILDIWSKLGVDNPSSLRRMLLKRTVGAVGVQLLQVLLDGGACAAAYGSGVLLGLQHPFDGLTWLAQAPVFALSGYFAAGVLADLFTLGGLLYATAQYNTSSDAFMEAVRQLAGRKQTGVGVIDQVQNAVNTVKVLEALDQIQAALKGEMAKSQGSSNGAGVGDSDTQLTNLAAYLTLDKAINEYGFDPSSYGLSGSDAGQVALAFARFDTNDDGRLEPKEFEQLVQSLGINLSSAEVGEAMKVLGKKRFGSYILFDEFVQWWVSTKSR